MEQQTYWSCMGLLKPAEKYSDSRPEAACKKVPSFTDYDLKFTALHPKTTVSEM